MRTLLPCFLLLAAACTSLPALSATAYVSDQFTVPLRGGPSGGHRILHRGLPSGTPLEVLRKDEAAGFTQVRMQNGTEGWVPTQYLTGQPIARERLVAANRRIESLENQLKELRGNYQEVRGARSQVESRASELGKQAETLQAELAEVRRVSATSLAHYEENKQLKVENQSQQTEITQLTERVRQLERNVMLRWLFSGGGLVLLGLVLGAWIKSRPKRSSWA